MKETGTLYSQIIIRLIVPGGLKYAELYPGEYRLTEVSTVEGYSLLAEPVYITIPYSSDTATETPSYTENNRKYYLDMTYTIQNSQVFEIPCRRQPGNRMVPESRGRGSSAGDTVAADRSRMQTPTTQTAAEPAAPEPVRAEERKLSSQLPY